MEYMISAFLNGAGYRNEIYNVGCMYWNYEPVTLDEILANQDNVKEDALLRYVEYCDENRTADGDITVISD